MSDLIALYPLTPIVPAFQPHQTSLNLFFQSLSPLMNAIAISLLYILSGKSGCPLVCPRESLFLNSGLQPHPQALFHQLFTLSSRSSTYLFLAFLPPHIDMILSLLTTTKKKKKILRYMTWFSPYLEFSFLLPFMVVFPTHSKPTHSSHPSVTGLLPPPLFWNCSRPGPSDLTGYGHISLLI